MSPPARRTRLEVDAHAKINLGLEILGQREDGYHAVRTIMQSVELTDRLQIEVREGNTLEVTTSCPELPRHRQNLAGMAVAAVLGTLGVVAAVRVHIEKRIPAGAGLGGGSADAAAALWGLNELLGRPLGAGRLYRLAAAIGSDVPFFLAGGTCLCTGRGELVRRLPPLAPCGILVATPPVSVETQWAYANSGRIGLTPEGRYTSMLESAIRQRSTSLVAKSLWNDFDAVVCGRLATVRDAKELLLGVGAMNAQVSGSGSAVFGLFENHVEVERVAAALRERSQDVHVTRPVRTSLVPRPSQ